MITLTPWNDDDFARAKPADPEQSRTFLETLSGYGRQAVSTNFDVGGLYDAAERNTRLVETASARQAAREAVYDRMIARVQSVTGERLDNPLMRNTAEIARRIGRGEFTGFSDPRLDELVSGREDAFLARVQELKRLNPEKLADVDPFTPVPEQARGMARQADADFQREWQRTDVNLVAQVAGLLAGGMVGSFRDPLFWLSLPFGGPGRATTAVGRIATATVTTGAANATFTAVAQPDVQAWRAEAGLQSGLGEALQNIGMAAVVGGVAGGGIQGLGELIGRARAGRLTAKEAEEGLARAGVFVDDDTKAALRGAEMADEADRASLPALPRGLEPDEARASLADAARAAADPDEPLPLATRPAPAGATDDVARRILDGTPDPIAAVRALRETENGVASALASPEGAIRDMGHVAALGDTAFAMVADGRASMDAGLVVARTTSDPARQAALLADAEAARAVAPREVREVVSDAVRAENAPAAGQAIMGAGDADVPIKTIHKRAKATQKKPLSLRQFLAQEGGVRPDPGGELRAHLQDATFIPGYGSLVRQTGMTLDDALQKAMEAGYFFDPAFDAGMARTVNTNDLLRLIAEDRPGRRVFAYGQELTDIDRVARERLADPAFMENDARHAVSREAIDRGLDLMPEELAVATDLVYRDGVSIGDAVSRVELNKLEAETGLVFDDALRARAIKIMDEERLAADVALERAAMEDYHRYDVLAEARHDITGDIPGWDFPPDPGAASPARGRGAESGPNAGSIRPDGGRAPGENARADGAPDRAPAATERTAQGDQILIDGVAPVTDRARAEAAAARPMRGGDRAPPAGGLFDETARNQRDLFDGVPVERADGRIELVPRDEIDSVAQRERSLADLVQACKV